MQRKCGWHAGMLIYIHYHIYIYIYIIIYIHIIDGKQGEKMMH